MKRYLICTALAGLVVTLSLILQPPISYNGGLGWDGAQYTQLAAQCGREAMHAYEPFAYRVGAPCLAALIPLPPKLGLWTVNILSSIVLLFGRDSQMLSVVFFSYWRTGSLEGAAVVGLIMTLLGLVMAMGVFLLQRFSRAGVEQAV